MPSLGYVFSDAPSSQERPTGGVAQPAVSNGKSIKTLLHQRANRIGKIENRISRLQSGLAEVQQNWPKYVHQMQQLINKEHQKCVQFTNKATEELQELRQELQQLLTQQITNVDMFGYQQTPVMPLLGSGYATSQVPTMPMPFMTPSVVDVANGQGMDVDSSAPSRHAMPPQHTVTQQPVKPLPCVGTAPMPMSPVDQLHAPPVLPMQNVVSAVPNLDTEIPPGNWAWPPQPPILPVQTQQEPDASDVVAPANRPTLPNVEVQSWPPLVSDPTAPEVPQAVNQVVHQAAQGLLALQQQQGQSSTYLTPEHQQQLEEFARQQMMCQQSLQQFTAQAEALNNQHAKSQNSQFGSLKAFPNRPAPYPATKPKLVNDPQQSCQADHMSVQSSPMKTPKKTGPACPQFLLSPEQPVQTTPFKRHVAAPLPGAEEAISSPTPVPTEKADSEDEMTTHPPALQQLE